MEEVLQLPPHLQEVFERYPELLQFVIETPIEELRDKLIMNDLPGDVPQEVIMELSHNMYDKQINEYDANLLPLNINSGEFSLYTLPSEEKHFIEVAAGNSHSIGLKGDGTVWTWGWNVWGQLGDGTTTNRTTPMQINGLSGVRAIAGGNSHTIALKDDGTVWTWGYNLYGQLGDGTTTNRKAPVQVSELSGVIAIAGGDFHSVALKDDGT